jgi:hypothetical protein
VFADKLHTYLKAGKIGEGIRHIAAKSYAKQSRKNGLSFFSTVHIHIVPCCTKRQAEKLLLKELDIVDESVLLTLYKASEDERARMDIASEGRFGTMWYEGKKTKHDTLHFVDYCERKHTCGTSGEKRKFVRFPDCEDEDQPWDDWPFDTATFKSTVGFNLYF